MARPIMPCRGCGEPMIFVTSKKGKRIPCDPELVRHHLYLRPPRGAHETSTVIVMDDGTTIRGVEASATEPGTTSVEGYVSHGSTCPKGESFRAKEGA